MKQAFYPKLAREGLNQLGVGKVLNSFVTSSMMGRGF
jgi:hypothetical protein